MPKRAIVNVRTKKLVPSTPQVRASNRNALGIRPGGSKGLRKFARKKISAAQQGVIPRRSVWASQVRGAEKIARKKNGF